MITPYSNTISVTTLEALLLDTYTGSAAAYSLRKLRSAYTGSAIRVRRASDSTEQDIGFVSNELDTATLASFCSGTDGFVTTWYDQSGSAKDATQATAANQPQIVSSGSVILDINNLPSISFDGINDNLVSSTFANTSQPYTFFLVQKWKGATFRYLIDIGLDVALGCVNISGPLLQAAYFGATLNSSLTANNTRNQIWYALGNASNSQLSINNESVITGNGGTRVANKITIGSYGGNSFHGNTFLCECIVYLSDQSSNRTGIETNINTFYSIY